ncbi:zinc-activated ligand-gated ion channel [Alligator mississippiensis]|uniref:Zinc-activated ligand-gated ion channel n=1 Tax=Alligator mississippiensis TaxID=8496 RepID=A0A151N327_ALLMI|nr:zinc-activated ligand-gated ion channel [Alligator mississippiensis]
MASGTAAEQNCTYYDVVKYLNFPSYNKHLLYTIPKKNWEDPLELKMDFSLVSILSVAEKLQTVTFYFLLTLRWKNALVTWKPQDFCGISKIILPEDTFWSPHIFIFEQVDKEKSSIIPFLSITHNGIVRTRQPHQVTITCSLKIHKFPFDAQTCNISITTFMYTVRDIIINPGQTEEDLNSKSQLYFQTDGEWKPLNIKIREHKVIEREEKFSVIVYEIFMQRQPLYYVVNLILPTCMLYLLDMALLFGPSSHGEKIGFQISLILGISMLAVILNDILPTSSESLPVIGTCF